MPYLISILGFALCMVMDLVFHYDEPAVYFGIGFLGAVTACRVAVEEIFKEVLG